MIRKYVSVYYIKQTFSYKIYDRVHSESVYCDNCQKWTDVK